MVTPPRIIQLDLPRPEDPPAGLFVQALLRDPPLLVEIVVLVRRPGELGVAFDRWIDRQAELLHDLGRVSVREPVVLVTRVSHVIGFLDILWVAGMVRCRDCAADIIVVVEDDPSVGREVRFRVPGTP